MICYSYRMTALDHRALRQVLAIADAGTLRAAARILNVSQPPLTAALRQLEARLGVALFDRSVRGMVPTPAGAALVAEARVILGRLQRAEARVRAAGGRSRPIRIGFVSAALNGPLPALLNGLRAEGEPTPQLMEMSTPEQIDALGVGRIDAGLLHPPVPALPDFDSVSLGRDPFWVALPADHPLAGREALRFAEIADQPFVLFPEAQGPVLYDRIRTLAAAAGHPLTVAAEARRVHSQLAIVAGGVGIALVTRSTARTLSFTGVATVPLLAEGAGLYLALHLMADSRLMGRLAAFTQPSS